MPRQDGSNASVCNSAGNHCFYAKMQNETYLAESCDCYPNCNFNHYTYTEKQLPIKASRECEKTKRGFVYAVPTIYDNIPYSTIVLEKLYNSPKGKPFDVSQQDPPKLIRDLCEEMYEKDFAIVEIKIEGQSFVKIRRSLRKTIGDKLGELGGTLGLFTGFSFMAVIEIIYWIIVILANLCNST